MTQLELFDESELNNCFLSTLSSMEMYIQSLEYSDIERLDYFARLRCRLSVVYRRSYHNIRLG